MTHEIEITGSQDDDQLRFSIITLGFLFGLRLLPEGWGHLHSTAIEVDKCNSFSVRDSEVIPCLELASDFYQRHHKTRNAKRMSSAISLLHWSQAQPMEFDAFSYLYMAVDACWAICKDVHAGAVQRYGPRKGQQIRHPERPEVMCAVLGLKLPEIFDPSSAITAASIRNDLIHEGLVGDLPIGQTVIKPHCTLEMREFAEKLILSLLGVQAGYLSTAGGDRQHHALDLKP
ncbi:hypothetical protein [Bradyrhizobium sp. 2S1]|uniref:hypothetical protein n=1 Tax=Bradyrhizobium sp. 2S1 TaxID=1404429 RepID=UPI00140C3CFE|nr:hypothetical protein [Bradyrhizobium sp. 2S1]MCK7664566.1 hypothetical protein [Bradyrhizobium sp. 2S1]